LYIKLGTSGSWEKESIDSGILRFGYMETPFEAAVSGDWEAVRKVWLAKRKNEGVATSDVTQIRYFFEADVDTLWITFYGGFLWWCFAKPGVKIHQDGQGTYRETVDRWHNTDINGKGTICGIKEFQYLKRKLNGQLLPAVDEAAQAENQMVQKIIPLMHMLPWQDFELLVDLVRCRISRRQQLTPSGAANENTIFGTWSLREERDLNRARGDRFRYRSPSSRSYCWITP
jgi:hypothetical protein